MTIFATAALPARIVPLDQQGGGQPVGTDPRIPVVGRAAREAHPAEIVAGETGRQDAAVDLQADALGDERRDLGEQIAHQVVGPGEQAGGLGGEQIDDRLGDVGQPRAGLLRAEMGRDAPEGLLAGKPDAVDDLVDEAALAFHALGDHERLAAGRGGGCG